MLRVSLSFGLVAIVVAVLSGCSGIGFRERPAWRTEAEEACLARGAVQSSDWIRPAPEIDGPGICGLYHPFRVSALAGGTVRLVATATLDCSMIPALDQWVGEVLQPAALARFGEPVVEIRTMGAYSCRGINNESGANLSEHAFGNAIDIAAFRLASGRELNVLRGWNGPDEQERAFLRDAHGGACNSFTTVLGPGSNAFHANHIHVDLALHGDRGRPSRRICKPAPTLSPPAPPQAFAGVKVGATSPTETPPEAVAPTEGAFARAATRLSDDEARSGEPDPVGPRPDE